jgi:hypothetical protein
VVSTAYVGVVLLGPKLMQNVKPFSLRKVIQVYNLMMIVVNAYIFQQVCAQKFLLVASDFFIFFGSD